MYVCLDRSKKEEHLYNYGKQINCLTIYIVHSIYTENLNK